MLLLNLLATPVITMILGKQWLPAVPYLEILAFQGIAYSLQGVNTNAIVSIGRSDTFFRATIIKRVVQICLLLLGMYYGGIMGLLWCTTFFSFFAAFYNGMLVHKYIGYTYSRQIKDLLPTIWLNIVSYSLAYILLSCVKEEHFLYYCLVVVVYMGSYVLLSFWFKINMINHLNELAIKVLNINKNK